MCERYYMIISIFFLHLHKYQLSHCYHIDSVQLTCNVIAFIVYCLLTRNKTNVVIDLLYV